MSEQIKKTVKKSTSSDHTINNSELNMEYEFHPAANFFPLLEGKQFNELVKDISENGLLNNIELYKGMILDGRNRYLACLKAEVEPDTINVDSDVKDPYLHVASLNLRRRHLTDDQRAALAVNLLEARTAASKKERAQKAGKAGGAGRAKNSSASKTDDKLNDKPKQDTRKAVAKEANVPENKLKDAVALKKTEPDAYQEVVAGKKSITEAKKKVAAKKTTKKKPAKKTAKAKPMERAEQAIKIMKSIPESNPRRDDAIAHVLDWCKQKLCLDED